MLLEEWLKWAIKMKSLSPFQDSLCVFIYHLIPFIKISVYSTLLVVFLGHPVTELPYILTGFIFFKAATISLIQPSLLSVLFFRNVHYQEKKKKQV